MIDGLFVCKYKAPEVNPIQNLFIDTYNRCNNARDGMSGSLNYSFVEKMASVNGIDDELFNDFIEFINECEYARAEKRAKEQKSK